MRRDLGTFLLFFLFSVVQIHWVNLLSATATVSFPLTFLLLLAPYLTKRQTGLAVLGSALPLDYTSALPFGSYLLSLIVLVVLVAAVSQRLPIRDHRLFHLALVVGGSLVFFLTLFVLTSLAVALRLAPWSFALDRGIILAAGQLLAWNTVLAALIMLFTRHVHHLFRRRFVLPHASH